MSCYHVVAYNEFKILLAIYEWTHDNLEQWIFFLPNYMIPRGNQLLVK
jgi:hypothetical protein